MVNPHNHVRRMDIEMADFGVYDIHIRAEEGTTLDDIIEFYQEMKINVDNMLKHYPEANTKANREG